MQITKIEQQKKNKRRYSVFLDGEYAFGLHQDLLFRVNLHTGDELTHEQVEQFQYEDQILAAKEAAFHLLKFRERSTEEIRDRLRKKQYSAKVIDEVIQHLVDKDFLNDQHFAEMFAEDQLARKNIGPMRLRAELQKKKLPKQLIEHTIEKTYQKYDIREQAEQAAAKKRKTLKNVDAETAYRRLTNYLARRGFSWEVISDVVNREDFI